MSSAPNPALQKPKSIREYISTLAPTIIDKLYSKSSANCLAVFRELPLLAKHYVLRLLFVEQTIPQAVVSSWLKQDSNKEHNEAIAILNSLKIWTESPMPGGLPGYILSDVFRRNLKTALLGGGDNWMLMGTSEKDKHERDEAFLTNYATERWECILQFMVGNRTEAISLDTVKKTLITGSLINCDANNPSAVSKITSAGFQFLLMNTRDQVWYFMLHYLDTCEQKGFDFVETLSFLIQLSFSVPGKDYSTDGLSDNLLQFLQNLREFGLIYQRKRKDGRFYPTRLVINLTNYAEEAGVLEKSSKDDDGFLIVETNYRVYSYTESPLRIALLSLFVELKYRFPKFCLGLLTRESVRKALRSGITAEQIINFLNMNCHKDMGKNGAKRQIPPTVMDQIRLWEIERDRFVFKDGVLYSQFLSQSDFELLRNYARDCGHLIWDNPSKRVMVVSHNGHEDVRRFWRRHRKDH